MQYKWSQMKLTHTHRSCMWCVCVFSASTLPDWFHHKIMLSSHPLKLWSHRYVCSICSAWHWIIHFLLFLSHSFCSHSSFFHSVFPCFHNFFSFLLFSLYVSVLFVHGLYSLPPSSFLCCPSFLPPHTHFFLSAPSSSSSSSTTIAPSVSSLYLSPVLSALRQVSAITPLHLLIPVLIQPSTQRCLTSLSTVLTHTYTHACRLHKCPRGCEEEPSVSTHSHPLTVQENALCKRTGSINLPAASAYSLMLFLYFCFSLTCMWLHFIAVTTDFTL